MTVKKIVQSAISTLALIVMAVQGLGTAGAYYYGDSYYDNGGYGNYAGSCGSGYDAACVPSDYSSCPQSGRVIGMRPARVMYYNNGNFAYGYDGRQLNVMYVQTDCGRNASYLCDRYTYESTCDDLTYTDCYHQVCRDMSDRYIVYDNGYEPTFSYSCYCDSAGYRDDRSSYDNAAYYYGDTWYREPSTPWNDPFYYDNHAGYPGGSSQNYSYYN